MTNLSPAAQAVLDAAINVAESPDAEAIAAAALRAAADQVCRKNASPVGDEHDDVRLFQWIQIRAQFLAIAAELEALP